MKQKNLKHILSFALAMLIAVTALLASTGCDDKSDTVEEVQVNDGEVSSAKSADSGGADEVSDAEDGQSEEVEEIGEGETVFRFEATDDKGTVSAWNIHTGEKTVGAALLAVGLIGGDESQYGLYVEEVNGLTADYDTDGAYWAFYINGVMAMTGVDGTDIEKDSVYAFIYTKE